jgi:predicted ArsR family transcriptional regulator
VFWLVHPAQLAGEADAAAVRAQLATLQQDGTVEQRGLRRGTSKPARTYAVTPDAEMLLSRAYIPILTQLLHVLAAECRARSLTQSCARLAGA